MASVIGVLLRMKLYCQGCEMKVEIKDLAQLAGARSETTAICAGCLLFGVRTAAESGTVAASAGTSLPDSCNGNYRKKSQSLRLKRPQGSR